MAILASTNIKTVFMNRAAQGTKLGTASAAITLYSGTKPTAANYIANFGTTYNSAAASFLWHNNTGTTWTQTGTTIYLSVPPNNAVPLHNGTATWAVLWTASIAVGNMGGAFPAQGNSGFMIVDVSTVTAGTGVVQLQSTSLTTADTAMSIDTAGFSIS